MKYRKPKKLNEANIAAELYYLLKGESIKCVLEYSATNSKGEQCRFDAVVVRDHEVIAIVECKNWRNPNGHLKSYSGPDEQLRKYMDFRVPIVLIVSMKGAWPARDFICHLYDCPSGVPLDVYEFPAKVANKRINRKARKKNNKKDLARLIKSQGKDMELQRQGRHFVTCS